MDEKFSKAYDALKWALVWQTGDPKLKHTHLSYFRTRLMYYMPERWQRPTITAKVQEILNREYGEAKVGKPLIDGLFQEILDAGDPTGCLGIEIYGYLEQKLTQLGIEHVDAEIAAFDISAAIVDMVDRRTGGEAEA